MIGPSQLFGGFSISPALARRMFEAVAEIHAGTLDLSLSHVDDDNCDMCKASRAAAEKEKPHDAPAPDRPGREWAA
jgi:hypothetical protein